MALHRFGTLWSLVLILLGCLLVPASAQLPTLAPGQIEVPDDFAKQFIVDYMAGDAVKMGKWIHPRRGVIDSRFLKTRDQFLGSYPELTKILKQTKVTYRFGEGMFNGDSFYKAIYPQVTGQFGKLPTVISLLCIFEKIGDQWFLVQAHRYDMASANWVTVGDKITDNRLKGTTMSGRSFSLEFALSKEHAVLLSFDDQVQNMFRDDNLRHMKAVKKWYEELKGKPIYVMNISEHSKERMEKYLADNKMMVPVVMDDKSVWHHALQVDQHPYLILIDHTGVLRAVHRESYDDATYSLFRQIVSDVVAQVPVNPGGQKSGTKAADPSLKF